MDDLLYQIISPPASLVMWLLFSREGAEIMPNVILLTCVSLCLIILYGYRTGKL